MKFTRKDGQPPREGGYQPSESIYGLQNDDAPAPRQESRGPWRREERAAGSFDRGGRSDNFPPRRRDEEQAPVKAPDASWPEPWVQIKYFSYSPTVYPRMIAASSPNIKPGALVTIYDRNGERFGAGFYNARARVPLRAVWHGPNEITEDYFPIALERAVSLRRGVLRLDETTEAYRVISSDGDGLSGLTVDRYADVLCIEVHSLGVWQRLDAWIPRLHELCGTKRHLVRVDPDIARIEGIRVPDKEETVRSVRIREHSVKYEVNFDEGHKTGFFCDQRDNRRLLSTMVKGLRVLDLCTYTGGFALSAKIPGQAAEVTAVDLDEKAIAQAQRNANINNVPRGIDWVHTDAFTYARTMIRNGEKWDCVVLDPPKLIHTRDSEDEEGRKKYEDLNGLAIQLVKPGGLFVSCSCSGLLEEAEFERYVIKGAHRNKRRLQFFNKTGASPDHPVMSNCLESRYLKVLWARVLGGE